MNFANANIGNELIKTTFIGVGNTTPISYYKIWSTADAFSIPA